MISISIPTGLIISISFIILLVIIGVIAYIIYKDKKSDQEEIDDLISDLVNTKERSNDEEIKVKKIETEKEDKLNLEQMLSDMQTNLDKKQNTIEAYEKEQDENAIISIKELKKVANSIKAHEKDEEENAITNYKQIDRNDNVARLEEKENLIKTPVKKAIAKIEATRNHKKFKSTDFISPIFGKMEEKIEYPKIKAYQKDADLNFNEYFGEDMNKYNHQLEQTLNIEPLNDEIKKNDEFLKALKEFRNNLE